MSRAFSLSYLSLVLTLWGGFASLSFGQSLAAQESAARQEAANAARDLLQSGDAAYKNGNFKVAADRYREALQKLPRQAKYVRNLRQAAEQRFAQAAVEAARDHGRLGAYQEANQLLDEVSDLADNPPYAVEEMRSRLQDPIRTNPSLSKEHSVNIDKVRRLLYEAEGYVDLGRFDRAFLTYEDVLRIDPYNRAARRGMERVDFHRTNYAGAAYDQARSKALMDVAAAWEQMVPPVIEAGEEPWANSGEEFGLSAIGEKLSQIRIPILDLEDALLDETIDYLRAVARSEDETTFDESAKGVDFILRLGTLDSGEAATPSSFPRITLQLRNVTLEQALKSVTEISKTSYRVDQYAVIITPLGVTDSALATRAFVVPPDFLSKASIANQAQQTDPFADESTRSGPLLAKKVSARERLEMLGIKFPEGATASFLPSTSTLTVRNTIKNLDQVALIVNQLAETEPVQVVVRTTIIDITQADLTELGYDWVLSDFGGDKIRVGGGTVGNGRNPADLIGGQPVTSGLRSGPGVRNLDSVDAVINRVPRASATGSSRVNASFFGSTNTGSGLNIPEPAAQPNSSPGALTFRGFFDDGLAQGLLRGVSQKTGADIMTKPSVITRSGQSATIKSVREFIYPTEYEPPEIPNSVGGSTISVFGAGSVTPTSTVVTPATPTSFETTDLGVTLEVLPEVSADRSTVTIAVKPRIREFQGFINYGSPITGQNQSAGLSFGLLGGLNISTDTGEITPNEILMPVFRDISVDTSVTITDGTTIVLGGLVRETRQLVNDKVPILGDLPLIGRFFDTVAIDSQQRNLIIMLKVELQDPAGRLYRDR